MLQTVKDMTIQCIASFLDGTKFKIAFMIQLPQNSFEVVSL